MKPYEELIAEAASADVTGWGFAWLDGRATEERPPWGYARLLGDRLATVQSALDIDTGGGEVVDEAPTLPPRMAVTETWPANASLARQRLTPRGVEVVEPDDAVLPFPDATFELVSSRHPVRPDWAEIHRVLAPGGHYLAQHVGPGSASEVIEFFLGPLPDEARAGRDPAIESATAERAGLVVDSVRTARCRMEFYDVGAVVWTLRKCVWWVPGFTVEEYDGRLRELDARMRAGVPFVAHSTRHLVEAHRPGEPEPPREPSYGQLERLDRSHEQAVLDFERDNRAWFARSMDDRGDAFFDGFHDNFEALLADQESGEIAFHVLLDRDGAVLGRFNLYDLKDGTAEVGYRVAQRVTGRGVATAGLTMLVRLAAERHALRRLTAGTSHDNLASQKVLRRAGFIEDGQAGPDSAEGRTGLQFRLDLPAR